MCDRMNYILLLLKSVYPKTSQLRFFRANKSHKNKTLNQFAYGALKLKVHKRLMYYFFNNCPYVCNISNAKKTAVSPIAHLVLQFLHNKNQIKQ